MMLLLAGDSVWHERVCGACDGRIKLARLYNRRRSVVPGPDKGGSCHPLGPGIPPLHCQLATLQPSKTIDPLPS